MKLKKGDSVVVLVGKDKGRKGKIKKIFPKTGKVLLPGINTFKKHAKSQGEKKPGGIIDIVKPLPMAKVALICPKCNQPTRVGFQIDKAGVKYRLCRKCQTII